MSWESDQTPTLQTIVAIPREGGDWIVEALELAPEMAEQKLTAEHPGARLVGSSYVPRWRFGQFLRREAARYDWLLDYHAGAWRSPEAVVSPPEGDPMWAKVELSLDLMQHGQLYLRLRSEAEVVTLGFHDVDDSIVHDTLIDIVDFTRQIVEPDRKPRFSVNNSATTVRALRTTCPWWCRLIAEGGSKARDRRIDVLQDRRILADTFRRCLHAVADSPQLGLGFIFSAEMDDTEYERLMAEAEHLWGQGVRDGRWPDDPSAALDFENNYRCLHGKLTPSQAAFLERYRVMLRTLEVPEDWN